jgi:hypothetical protein
MKLDLSALRESLAALDKSLMFFGSDLAKDPDLREQFTFMQVIRTAAEAGLIADVGRFKDYRDKQNITSHTYNQKKAEDIAHVLPAFAADARFLLAELERRNNAGN